MHIKTDRKGRDAKRAALHRRQLIFQRAISAAKIPPEKHGFSSQMDSPAQSTRAGNRHPHNIWVWKSVGILSSRERLESARESGALLKGQHTKSHLQPLTVGGQSELELHAERLGFMSLGRELKGQPEGSLCWVPLPHLRHHLSWVEQFPS